MDSKVIFCTLTQQIDGWQNMLLATPQSRPAFQFLQGLLSQQPLSFPCLLPATLPLRPWIPVLGLWAHFSRDACLCSYLSGSLGTFCHTTPSVSFSHYHKMERALLDVDQFFIINPFLRMYTHKGKLSALFIFCVLCTPGDKRHPER